MENREATTILNKLLKAKTSEEVDRIIESHLRKLPWIPFGGDYGNKAPITAASDPIRAIVERGTNCFDTIVERRIIESGLDGSTFTSPVDAVEKLFPKDESRNERALIQVNPEPLGKADWARSTVDILDYGTGIFTQEFPNTILSLLRNNKIGKRYAIGVYGQGGSASIGRVAGDGYVAIVSKTSTNIISYTIIRYSPPTEQDKRGFYEYIADENKQVLTARGRTTSQPKIVIPRNADEFCQGTLVRHFGYDLSAYKNRFSQDKEGCASALNTYLFRPPLPLHLDVVLKKGTGNKKKGEVPKGERGDLRDSHLAIRSDLGEGWRGDKRTIRGVGVQLDEANESKVEYAAPTAELPLVLGDKKQGTLKVSYYVVHPDAKSPLTHPTETVLGTFNGQTQHECKIEDVSPKIREAYDYICAQSARDLIVEIRVDHLSTSARDGLLSSNRESFTDGECWKQIKKLVTDLLMDDEQLESINNERYQKMLAGAKKGSGSNSSDAFKYATEFVASHLKSIGQLVAGGTTRVRKAPKPLTVIKLQKDHPTFVRFVADSVTFNTESESRRYLTVETDAPNGYRLPTISFEGEGDKYLTPEIVTPLKNGRLRVAVALTGGRHGMIGEITAHYNKEVTHAIAYEIVKQEPITRSSKGVVKGSGTGTMQGMPEVTYLAITPESEQWKGVFGSTSQENASFSITEKDGKLHIFWSKVFPPFESALSNCSAAEIAFIEDNYEAGLAVAAYFLSADKMLTGVENTPEIFAQRKALAAAILMTAEKALDATAKKKSAKAGI